MNLPPRNPFLYELLRRRFGEVHIQNAGEPFLYTVSTGTDGKEVVKISGGEEYCVCCPHCNDKRFRLNVNHMMGERIADIRQEGLAHCWNEECPEAYKDVIDMLERAGDYDDEYVQAKACDHGLRLDDVARSSRDNHLKLDKVFRLDEPSVPHDFPEVAAYVEQRGFDLKHLGERYGVHYCRDFDVAYAYKRLIFPVLYEVEGRLVVIGWQARAIPRHSPRQRPKYWTSPGYRKSFFLYDFVAASQQEFAILVEGPTDAINVGRPAAAILGKTLSTWQANLIFETWIDKSGPIIMLTDPGFEQEWGRNRDKVRELFRAHDDDGRRVILVECREKDPGAMNRDVLWERIIDESRSHGFDVRRPHSP